MKLKKYCRSQKKPEYPVLSEVERLSKSRKAWNDRNVLENLNNSYPNTKLREDEAALFERGEDFGARIQY